MSAAYTFMTPNGDLGPETCHDALLLVLPDPVPLAMIRQWTRVEQLIAYDWAMRLHFQASDVQIAPRDQPWFLLIARGMIPVSPVPGQSPAQILSAALRLAAERVTGTSPEEKAARKAHLRKMAGSVEELGDGVYPDDASAQAAGYSFDPRSFPGPDEVREALGDPDDKAIRDALAAWGRPDE